MRSPLAHITIFAVSLFFALGSASPAAAGKLPEKFANGFCEPRSEASSDVSYGIDVSAYQGDVDWARVNVDTGILYTFIRASEGFIEDKKFKQNWAGAGEQCLLRGVYHFFAEHSEAKDQAEVLYKLLKATGALEPELAIVVDIEQKSAAVELCGNEERVKRFVEKLKSFIETFETATQQKLIIYTNKGFWDCLPGTDEIAQGRKLWIAHYTRAEKPKVPEPWKSWTFCQFFDNGRVAGISGAVDADRFNGSGADLIKFAQEN